MGVTLLPALYVHAEIGSRDDDVKVARIEGQHILRSIGLEEHKSYAGDNAARKIASMVRSVARSNFEGLIFREERVDDLRVE